LVATTNLESIEREVETRVEVVQEVSEEVSSSKEQEDTAHTSSLDKDPSKPRKYEETPS